MAVASDTCTQSPTKRKPSVAGFPNGIRPAKRRAAKACQTCRSRKVRCDVVYCDGKPCNNCRLDEVECVVSDSRRKRKLRSDGGLERSPVSVAEADAGELKSSSTQNNYTCSQFSLSLCNDTLFFNPSTGNSFELELDHHVPHMLYRTQDHRSSQEERIRRISLNSEQSTSSLRATAFKARIPISLSEQSSEVKVEKLKEPFAAVLTPPPETSASNVLSHARSIPDRYDSFEDKALSNSDDFEESPSGRTVFPHDSNTTTASENGSDADFDLLFNTDPGLNFSASDEDVNESDPNHCVQ